MSHKIDPHSRLKHISYFFTFISRATCWVVRFYNHVKVRKYPGLPKPPYIVISTHSSIMDFPVSIKAVSPNRPYWVCSVEAFTDYNFLFNKIGVIPKRKFTNDPVSAKIFMDVLTKKRKALIIYPEARFSFVGKQERIDNGLGRLAKICKVPVVFLRCNGHYLCCPQWGDGKFRRFRHFKRMTSEVIPLVTKDEVLELPADEITNRINKAFNYNDYQYQLDNGIKIKYKKRAEGIERVLYKCPHCGEEFHMSSKGTTFKCDRCGALYNYNEDGSIQCLTETSKFTRIQDWYDWEKEETRKEILEGKYCFEDKVRVEKLIDAKIGFMSMGDEFTLVHDEKGFLVKGIDNNGQPFEYERNSSTSYAVAVFYNYKNKGGCLDLATTLDTYFVYPTTKEKWLTKIHFATEILYDLAKANISK